MDYYDGGDLEKPYLISGADDRQVKIWDYQVQYTNCVYRGLVLAHHFRRLIYRTETACRL